MIRFPRKLQQIYTFENDDIWYVANLQMGELFEIDAITAEILEVCDTCNNTSILKKLNNRYSEEQILESMHALAGEIETLLFEPDGQPISSAPTVEERLRLFIPYRFMRHKEILSPNTNVEIYNLLMALAKSAEVFVEIDDDPAAMEQREHLKALGIQFVSDYFKHTNPYNSALNRFIVDDCDGILSLSPHPYEELSYFRHNTIPIISRIYSDRNVCESTLNKAITHQALRRNFDEICPDSPWIVDELAAIHSFLPETLHTIPNGVDTQVYSPKDRQEAREAVASIVEDQSIKDAPLVGILNGFQPQNSIAMRGELANLHKDVVFIVLDPILAHQKYQQHRNVFYINLQEPEDTLALPWIYNACELIIFPTVIGTSFSMVLEALACGVPGLALNSTELPEDLAACLISVPLTRVDMTGKFMIPTAVISEWINTLIKEEDKRESLSVESRQVAKNYSWDKTAQRFVTLFSELNRKRDRNVTPKYPDVAFAPYFEKGQNVVKTGATQLDSFIKQRVEEGVAQTLLGDHTLEEVRVVLRYLIQDNAKADKLLATLTP